MPVTIKRGFRQMLDDAATAVEEVSVQEVERLRGAPGVAIIDVRDRNELEKSGTVPGAHHSPRGMLEFHADPASPMHKKIFSEAERLVLYCGTSGRSALAAHTLQQMGFANVAHMAGGLQAWIAGAGALEPFTPDDAPEK